jgi:uncharacterized protein involved in type VI secretion and phage assembly
MARIQDDKRTKVSTVLDKGRKPDDEDLLWLLMAQGSEGVSLPYAIDLQMYARHETVIEARQLINTPATISLRIENTDEKALLGHFRYETRKGIFANFSRQPRMRRRFRSDYNIYTGRLVPAFAILQQEVRFRIFEKMSTIAVIRQCIEGFDGLNLGSYVDPDSLGRLEKSKDLSQELEHCVQYGESTFNFLCRLMARSNIFYFFDHDGPGEFETMVLGMGPVGDTNGGFKSCTVFNNHLDPRDLHKKGKLAVRDWEIVTGLSRIFVPAPKLVRTGEFNTVIPTQPPQSIDGTAEPATVLDEDVNFINPGRGFEPRQPNTSLIEPTTGFIQESFPDLGANSDVDATRDAATQTRIAEAQAETVAGSSGNPSFCAGRVFRLEADTEEDLNDRSYLITQMSFAAYDRNYLFVVEPNSALGMGGLLDDLVLEPLAGFADQFDDTQSPELASLLAAAGLINYLGSWNAYAGSLQRPLQQPTGFPADPIVQQGSLTGQMLGQVGAALGGFAGIAGVTSYGVLQRLLPIIRLILRGVVKILEVIVALGAGLLLGIPSIIQLILHQKPILTTVLEDIKRTEIFLNNEIDVFTKPKFIDAYSASFIATPVGRRGRKPGAGLPLPVAQKTVVYGSHLATVIGPTGVKIPADGGKQRKYDLYADKLGRVRIRFPWDRSPIGIDHETVSSSTDKPQFLTNRSTVWVRVSEAWAGVGFGSQFLPRIGDEVVVSFIDGDPDRPVITGRLYNPRSTLKSNLPFPVPGPLKSAGEHPDSVQSMDDLTDIATTQDFTRNGVRTSLFGQNTTQRAGFHLLRFDDKFDEAQLLLRADGRLDMTALRSHYDTTEGNRHVRVVQGKDKDSHTVGGNQYSSFYGAYSLTVGGANYVSIGDQYQLTTKGDVKLDLKKNLAAVVGSTISLNGTTIVLEAMQKITLKVGPSSIVISACGINLLGPIVDSQLSGDPEQAMDLKAMKDVAGAEKADPGEPDDWTPPRHSGGGGSGQHDVPAQHSLGCTLNANQQICVALPNASTPMPGSQP